MKQKKQDSSQEYGSTGKLVWMFLAAAVALVVLGLVFDPIPGI